MPVEDQAQDNKTNTAARFAHELASPIGSAGHALELMELQLMSLLGETEKKWWQAGSQASLVAAPATLKKQGLSAALERRLANAFAKNAKVELLLAENTTPERIERSLKIFEMAFSHKCARAGLETSQAIIKNLRNWQMISEKNTHEKFWLVETIQKAWAIVSMGAKNLSAQWVIKESPTVFGNEAGLTQVWINIFRNAHQVNPEGCKITVSTEKKNDKVILTISNTGKPLPKGLKLFEKGESRRKGGTGQGLHLCKEVVEAHGGNIKATTKTNRQGVEFIVELPLQ